MIRDNLHFTIKELPQDRVEITGEYAAGASLIMSDAEYRNDNRMLEEAKNLIEDQIRRGITADVLDVPYLKLLYRNEAVRNLVADALDRHTYELKVNRKAIKAYSEDITMLEKIIYDLRTKSFD